MQKETINLNNYFIPNCLMTKKRKTLESVFASNRVRDLITGIKAFINDDFEVSREATLRFLNSHWRDSIEECELYRLDYQSLSILLNMLRAMDLSETSEAMMAETFSDMVTEEFMKRIPVPRAVLQSRFELVLWFWANPSGYSDDGQPYFDFHDVAQFYQASRDT